MRRGTGAIPAAASAVLLLCPVAAVAGTWGSEPAVSLSSEYSSNPRMAVTDRRAVESAAFAASLPATYIGDRQTLDLQPRFRAVATHGDAALISDYQYLDATWRLTLPRDALQAGISWHRDSTDQNRLENTAALPRAQRRQDQSATLSWDSQLTERTDLVTSASWNRVAYTQVPQSALNNYRYLRISAQLNRALTERLQWTLGVGSARYELADVEYRTDEPFVQTSLRGQLSEAWSLQLSAGAASLRERVMFGPFLFHDRQSSATYTLRLERRDDRGALAVQASRSIEPSGFGALIRKDEVTISDTIQWSERWTTDAFLYGTRQNDLFNIVDLGQLRYYGIALTTTWRWSERWTAAFQVSHNLQTFGPRQPRPVNTLVALSFSRTFGRADRH